MFRPILIPLIAALVLPVAACNRSDEGTSVSINAEDGNSIGSLNGNTGEMKIDVPGFQASVKLPKIQFDAGDFDLNGVKLYPGSTIENINILGNKTGKDGGGIKVSFASPATPATIQNWFQERLNTVGYAVKADGAGLTGTTDENKPFHLALTPEGSGKAKGEIVIGN